MTPTHRILDYYQRQTCPVQWLEFNKVLAAELRAGLPPEEIGQMFNRIGERFAQAMPVEHCNTLDELQSRFNDRWDAIGWGFSTLQETQEHLHIVHACSPLTVGFGPASEEWAAGFLEGVYQSWFAAQGIPSGLRVRAEAADPDGLPQILLRLGQFHS